MAQILRIGIAAGATFALDLGSWAIFVSFVIGKFGADVLAGNNAATSFMQLSFMPAYGLSIGLTALVGRYIGQGDYRAAKRRAYLGMACACCYMTLMGAVFYIFRRPLIGLFRHEPEVIAAGSLILTYIPLFQFADAFGIVSAGALKGAGDTRFPAVAQIVFAWLFFLPLVFCAGQPAASEGCAGRGRRRRFTSGSTTLSCSGASWAGDGGRSTSSSDCRALEGIRKKVILSLDNSGMDGTMRDASPMGRTSSLKIRNCLPVSGNCGFLHR